MKIVSNQSYSSNQMKNTRTNSAPSFKANLTAEGEQYLVHRYGKSFAAEFKKAFEEITAKIEGTLNIISSKKYTGEKLPNNRKRVMPILQFTYDGKTYSKEATICDNEKPTLQKILIDLATRMFEAQSDIAYKIRDLYVGKKAVIKD